MLGFALRAASGLKHFYCNDCSFFQNVIYFIFNFLQNQQFWCNFFKIVLRAVSAILGGPCNVQGNTLYIGHISRQKKNKTYLSFVCRLDLVQCSDYIADGLLFFIKCLCFFLNFDFHIWQFFSHIDMKKPSSEIGIWRPRDRHPGYARCLSRRTLCSYLYEKKLQNMKIENFKKPQKKYKK